MPNAKTVADTYLPYLNKYMEECHINTPKRAAHFLAQIAHESGELQHTSENLNYSADGLLKTFPKYFTAATAKTYARHQEKIANRVYASRMGNGNEASGDGWKFRGRGLIGYTGRSNYAAYAKWCGYDVVADPDLLSKPLGATRSACHYFEQYCNTLADKEDGKSNAMLLQITKRINGGTIGYLSRSTYFQRAKKIFKL